MSCGFREKLLAELIQNDWWVATLEEKLDLRLPTQRKRKILWLLLLWLVIAVFVIGLVWRTILYATKWRSVEQFFIKNKIDFFSHPKKYKTQKQVKERHLFIFFMDFLQLFFLFLQLFYPRHFSTFRWLFFHFFVSSWKKWQ